MNKQAPSVGQLITVAGFALACFALLLFVWTAFGGPTPLAAEGYKLKMPLTQINQLAEQSQVKISGLEIGRVSDVQLGQGDERDEAIVTLEIEPEYAPLPVDTRAILRAKSLLGEAYVELAPGNRSSGMLEDGSSLPAAQVAASVQLDEVLRTYDRETREAFMQGAIDNAIATRGRGATLNQTLGVLPGTLTELDDVLNILNQQEEDVTRLIRNTGVLFDALSRRQGQLSGLIRGTNTVFRTTAERNVELAEFFRAFPTFLRESRLTQERLGDFSEVNTPNVEKMVPVARQLSPTFEAAKRLAPESLRFYQNTRPLLDKAPRAFPSLRGFLDSEAPRLLARLPDYLAEFTPLVSAASYYRRELAAFLGNAAAATNARSPYGSNFTGVRYIRAGVTLGPESATAFGPQRLTTNRSNPYPVAGSSLDFAGGGLPVFDSSNCVGGLNATVPEWAALTPVQQAQYEANLRYPFTPEEVERQYNEVITFGFAGALQTDNVPAPACPQQAPFAPLGDPSRPATQYQHVYRQP
jgi:phospholipid/cholesterol/gamma-HCH transport system substrate-binding protein